MPNFRFDYTKKELKQIGSFIDRPIVTVTLGRLDAGLDHFTPVQSSRYRVDTGADMCSVPMQLAADVLHFFPGHADPTDDELRAELWRQCQLQSTIPFLLKTASAGKKHVAFPLRVPVRLTDDDGNTGDFETIIAFVDGQSENSLLVGLAQFLDQFDVTLAHGEFTFVARDPALIRCSGRHLSAVTAGS
jgi:hypothetical protein